MENEIRFTPPPQEKRPEENVSKTGSFSKRIIRKTVKVLFALVIVAAIITAGFWIKKIIPGGSDSSASPEANASAYSAVFLSNGQVYFGRLKSQSSSEFVLTDVYYLQLAGNGQAQTQLSEPKFSLIKLGNELHGPTDELFINTQQVLFWENLRGDSKVVQSIESQK